MARDSFCVCLFFLLCLLCLCNSSHSVALRRKQQVSAMFVFGDSIVDNGNNVYIDPNITTIYLPYGVDFPTGPTGRYSNGRNPTDILGQLLGLPHFLPAAKDPLAKGKRILYGVNYASGGAGVLDSTGAKFAKCIPMNQQIKHFETITLPDLRTQLSKRDQLCFHLSKSLFVMHAGGNDCGSMCRETIGQKQKECASDEFLDSLLENFILQVKKVYDLGGRKFVLFGIQAIGCNPLSRQSTGKCREDMNRAAVAYNSRLRSSIDKLQHDMPGSNFVYIDTYRIIRDVFDNPGLNGFKEVRRSCCTTSGFGCIRGNSPCKNRNEYMYFDGAHFTEALYKHLARKVYLSELPEEVYPFNVALLAGLG
ncbi:unnamed protein product [Victoria cruziana]